MLSKKEGLITAFGSRIKKIIELRPKNVKGHAYFFERINPDQIEEDFQTKKAAGLGWFSIIFSRFRPIMNEIVLASIFINLLSLAMPLFIMSIYDKVIGSGSTESLKNIFIGVGIVISAESVLRMILVKSIIWLGVGLIIL